MFRTLQRFLRRLCADTAGNTLAITGAAIVLLLAGVGGGVDISRAYMTKTNLQSACDAGVLAGRKAMASSGEYTAGEKAKADKMFAFNLNTHATNLSDVEFDSEANDDGSVTGTASAKMPTVIMQVFKFTDFDLSVECSAELQMASADVIFVLDTTLSMNCADTDLDCNSRTTEHSSSRLAALRQAVKDFHFTVAKSVVDQDSTIIRYAFVPYSATVNVSQLVADGKMPASWFATTHSYWTRTYKFGTTKYYNEASVTTLESTTEQYTSNISKSDCDKYAANSFPTTGSNPVKNSGTAPGNTIQTTYSLNKWNAVSGNRGTCIRNKIKTEVTYDSQNPYYKIESSGDRKTNILQSIAVSDLIGMNEVRSVDLERDPDKVTKIDYTYWKSPQSGTFNARTLAELTGTANIPFLTGNAAKWNGCVEERGTTTNETMNPVPSGAWDLRINDEPSSDDVTKWKPHWPQVLSSPNQIEECTPTPIQQFQIADTKNQTKLPDWLDDYLTGLSAAGYTYHDMGMIWAARIGSTTGMFKDNVNNVVLPSGETVARNSVSRHIIFLTDGVMNPTGSEYTAYGIEDRDHRVRATGSSTALKTIHNNRFKAACRAAEEEGYTVWVIAFAKEITVEMQNCSTDGRYYHATDTTSLSNAFKFIAGQVADLRINR